MSDIKVLGPLYNDYYELYSIEDYDKSDYLCGVYGRRPFSVNIFYELDGYLVITENYGHSFDYVPSTQKLNY